MASNWLISNYGPRTLIVRSPPQLACNWPRRECCRLVVTESYFMGSDEQEMLSVAKDEHPFRIGFLIHDVSRLRRTVVDKVLRPMGVTRSQWWVLANLSRHNRQGM